MKILIFFVLTALSLYSCAKNEPIRGTTMGTTYMVRAAGKTLPVEFKNVIDSVLRQVNLQMSTYMPQSEISRFNAHQDTAPFHISRQFGQVLRLSHQIYQQSAGAFDVSVAPLVDLWGFGKKGRRQHVPPAQQISEMLDRIGMDKLRILNDTTIAKKHPLLELDLSAVAKGFGVDAVAELLDERGYQNYLVEIGGEVFARGSKEGVPWKIGVDRPDYDAPPGVNLQAVLTVHDQGVATSGDYRNYFVDKDSVFSHTMNPLTGRPILNQVASVTVTAPTCAQADAMATAIMVLGAEKSLAWVESNPEVECYIILRAKNGYVEKRSSGFPALETE